VFLYRVDLGGSRWHGATVSRHARKEAALSGAVVVSMAGLTRSMHGSLS
jgi:hypothetical protein